MYFPSPKINICSQFMLIVINICFQFMLIWPITLKKNKKKTCGWPNKPFSKPPTLKILYWINHANICYLLESLFLMLFHIRVAACGPFLLLKRWMRGHVFMVTSCLQLQSHNPLVSSPWLWRRWCRSARSLAVGLFPAPRWQVAPRQVSRWSRASLTLSGSSSALLVDGHSVPTVL